MNPVNERLGRRRGNYAERAHKKKVRQVCNQLAQESGWKSDLARSCMEVLSDEEVER